MKMKKLLALLLASAAVFSLAACGDKKAGGSASASKKQTMDADQTYTVAMSSEPSTLDPSKVGDIYGVQLLTNTMEMLTRIRQKEDGSNEVTAAGAKSWESNDDGTVWTFHLRDNKWDDGKAVTAQDYVYGLQRMLDPKTASPFSYMVTCIKNGEKVNAGKLPLTDLGAEAVDDHTLKLTLEAPTPYFMALTYSAMYPVRQDIVEKYGEKYGSEAETLVSNGPFSMKKWSHNAEIVLVRNKSYWDKQSVKLQTIDYKILSDEIAMYNSFDNGSIDTTGCGKKEWIDRFKKKSNAKYTTYANPSVDFMFFNQKDKLFKNENIRKAFTVAVNRDDIVKTIYQGLRKPAYTWVPEGVSTGKLGEFRKEVNYEPTKELIKENPDAKALLLKGMEELGLGSDPSKLKVTYSMGGTAQWARDYGEYMQQAFKKTLGVTIELDYNEWPTFQSKINNYEYQIADEVMNIGYNDPMDMLIEMISTANVVPTGWVNAEFDSVMKQASTEMDETKRVELYKKAETILLQDDCVLAPVVNSVVNRFTYDYVKNQNSNYFASTYGGMKYTYISGRK